MGAERRGHTKCHVSTVTTLAQQPCARTSGRTRPELRMTPSERGSQRKQAQVNYSYTHYHYTFVHTSCAAAHILSADSASIQSAQFTASLSLSHQQSVLRLHQCVRSNHKQCGSGVPTVRQLLSRLVSSLALSLSSHLRPRLRHTSPGIATHRSRNRGTHTIGSTHACLVTSATVRPASSRAPGGISAAAPK